MSTVPPPATSADQSVWRLDVICIGLATIVSIASAAVLAYAGKTVPDSLTAFGATGLGALSTMLSRFIGPAKGS